MLTAAGYSYMLTMYQAFPISGGLLFLTDAPHGRFTPSLSKSKLWTETLTVNGTISWMLMELPSPLSLLYVYTTSPLTSSPRPSLYSPSTLLVALYVVHYANRAIISPLRTPSRSRAHVIIPLASVIFNVLNGSLMGAWLSSGVINQDGWSSPSFWAGIALFVAGLAGNILHDEVLLDIRRKNKRSDRPNYEVPYGHMYRFISYPNYFCEWLEWTGFAIAASVASSWTTPFLQSPPWLFVLNEVTLMLPRALSGHKWYHQKFEDYPKDRKAVIPFLL